MKSQHPLISPANSQDENGSTAEKDVEKREIQLEVLCAILASMGSSLSDPTVWSEENRLVIEKLLSTAAGFRLFFWEKIDPTEVDMFICSCCCRCIYYIYIMERAMERERERERDSGPRTNTK